MSRPDACSAEDLTRIVRRILLEGKAVDIEGLGRFEPDGEKGFRFLPCTGAKVFLAYVEENRQEAEKLFDELANLGYEPWMDERKLLPGQNWARAIEVAIETADFVVAIFSSAAVGKRGSFQAEIRYALDCARRVPLDEEYLIPVRLDPCPLPRRIKREWHYIDLYPDWAQGVTRLRRVMERQARRYPRAA